jgi:phage baseplate assembly protein W
MPSIVKRYKDLDLNLIPHPTSGDIISLKDADAVKRSIRNLVLTGVYERLFQPRLGSGIQQLLFEPINPLTQKSIEIAIEDVIRKSEKRASLLSVVANSNIEENGYNITITFAIDAISEIATVDMFLERVR